MSIRKLENLMISLYYYLMADGKKKGGRGAMADPGGGLQGLQPLLEIGKN